MDVHIDRASNSSSQGSSFHEVWPQIEPLIRSIFSNDTLSKSDWQKIFWKVHSICMWDPSSAYKLLQKLKDIFLYYITNEQEFIFDNVDSHQSLMKAYMSAWKRFMFYYTYVPLPFAPLEKLVFNRGGPVGDNKKNEETENFLRLSMLEMWVLYIFSKISNELIHGAMLLVDSERKNVYSDSQLIIGVKESCVYLCKYLPNSSYIYQNNFEAVYLATIEQFYQSKSEEYYENNGILAYIRWVDQKIKEESERANRYLEPNSFCKVLATCVSTLVARYKDQFADRFLDLIKCKDTASLTLMFSLLDLVEDGIEPLLERFEKYITNIGMENLRMEAQTIIQDSEKYIENLLKLFNMATDLIEEAFNSDPRFLTTRDMSINMLINDKSIFALASTFKSQHGQQNSNANNLSPLLYQASESVENSISTGIGSAGTSTNTSFETNTTSSSLSTPISTGLVATGACHSSSTEYSMDIRNSSESNLNFAHSNIVSTTRKTNLNSRNAELFANYCDLYLRRTNVSRFMSSEHIDFKLKNVILLLKYLHDKDVFMKFYKAHLTRRLILDVSVDLDKEETMVTWLREVGMPSDYVNRISRMFQDLKVSEDFNHQYKSNSCDKHLMDFINVKILNSSTWSRTYEKVNVSLPAEIEEILPKIEAFYKNKHNGRNLFWHHQFSYGVVTFNSENGSYDFDVTSYQLAILSCWNERPNDAISLETLSLSTQLPNLELKKTLLSLVANPKLKTQLLIAVNNKGNNNITNSCGNVITTMQPPKQLSQQIVRNIKEFRDDTKFKLNLKFSLYGKNGRMLKRGRFNLIGRLQLQSEKFREDETENILKLRSLRTQEAIMKILKMRKSISLNALQLELTNVLKEMFVPSKSLIKDQLEWLIDNQYIQRDPNDSTLINYY